MSPAQGREEARGSEYRLCNCTNRWLLCHVSPTERAPAWRLRGERPPAIFLRGSGDERKFLGAPVPSVCSSGQNGEDRQDSRRY